MRLVAFFTNPVILRRLHMTYLQFHLIFNLPLMIILGILNWNQPLSAGEWEAMGLVLLAVFIFTTPWDNIAAKWGIWGFPEGKYLVKIGYLPIEEYSFFLFQSIIIILLERLLFQWIPDWRLRFETEVNVWQLYLLGLSVPVWLLFAFCLRWVRRTVGSKMNYTNHLAWFLPVIYAQWVLAPHLFLAYTKLLFVLTAAGGIYYSLTDIIAIWAGTWYIDSKQSTGFKLAKILPWEESAFFFLTSLLVAQSYLMLLPSENR